jgi:hypothetical protein
MIVKFISIFEFKFILLIKIEMNRVSIRMIYPYLLQNSIIF